MCPDLPLDSSGGQLPAAAGGGVPNLRLGAGVPNRVHDIFRGHLTSQISTVLHHSRDIAINLCQRLDIPLLQPR